jgi:DNA polymerase III alpha subunit (gram-positive type)
MPDAQSDSSTPHLFPLQRPRCPKCQNQMTLARIMPGPDGFDLRNFECDKCDHVVTLTIATDPMHSAVGWLNGELKAPE